MTDLYALAGPLLRRFDPERAHALSLWALKRGLVPQPHVADDPILHQHLWGLDFPNPVGLAAGYDKHAEVPDALLGLGFGFVEVGGVTPLPQPGNPKPRLFRLTEDEGVINRLGFNSEGLETVKGRLATRARRGIVGVNLGKNTAQEDAAADYVRGAAAFAPHVDFLVCNVSSPNTPGLRALQGKAPLTDVIRQVQAALAPLAQSSLKVPPLLLKIAPDITEEDKRDIAEVALSTGVAGLIVGNTTITRPPTLKSRHAPEAGGLSGQPLFALSTAVLGDMYALTAGRLPLIGAGGIGSARDAYAKIRAGASLLQLYSALVFRGPALIAEIRTGLAALLRRDGFSRLGDAVGADRPKPDQS
jgi:dihydroorotate dehydrogenase